MLLSVIPHLCMQWLFPVTGYEQQADGGFRGDLCNTRDEFLEAKPKRKIQLFHEEICQDSVCVQ